MPLARLAPIVPQRDATGFWRIAVTAFALAVFFAFCAWDWHLPGLYMDAVNPEYIIPGIFDPSAPGNRPWILPGNALQHRFPVFTGTLYHGSTQLYFALPFMALLGVGIASLRIVQAIAGGLILLLLLRVAMRDANRASAALAAGAAGLIALDPTLTISLRTQAYSCLFPLMLLFGSILLLRARQESANSTLRLVGSGVLFGLAVFSYFIFSFFLPAMLWLVFRECAREPRTRNLRLTMWVASLAIGYAPFALGLLLLERDLGGIGPLLHWLHARANHLQVMGSDHGILERVRSVLGDVRHVVDGEWPWLMIFKHHSGNVVGTIRAAVLLVLPLGVLIGGGRAANESARTVRWSSAFMLSFIACASIFGERLDGHHYTVLIPWMYIAFGAACAVLWPNAHDVTDGRADAWNAARKGLVAAAIALVVVANVLSAVRFHRNLRENGGAGFYSSAVDRFSADVLQRAPDATVYFPDWGYVMPFMFTTRAQVALRDSVDPRRLRTGACAGKPQIVVFTGDDNLARFDFVASLTGQPRPIVTTWREGSGRPMFQSATYAPRTGCVEAPPDEAAQEATGKTIAVRPAWSYACGFLSPIVASVHWNATDKIDAHAEIWIAPPHQGWKPWINAGPSGERDTEQWASPGMKFALIDPKTRERIAETEIETRSCPVR